MANPTVYTMDPPYRDGQGDLIFPLRVRNASTKDADRITLAYPLFIGLWPIRGFLGVMKAAGALLSIFG